MRIFTEPQQGASYPELLRVVLAAEKLGFEGFFRSDHYLAMGPDNGGVADGDDSNSSILAGLPGPTDAWITLAGLARDTTTIRLGTLVNSATFRLPGPLAISVAQVDDMSGGRIELGMGAGWFAEEHAAYGIPFPATAERFEKLEEQVAILHGLWTTPVGQRFDFSGRHYRLADSPALPKPVQSPHPPLIMGGAGKKRSAALAARFADEYNCPFEPPAETAEVFGRVKRAVESAGRRQDTMRLSSAQVVCAGRSDAEVRRRAEVIGRDVADLRASGLAGSPAEIVDKIGRFAAVDTDTIYLQVLDLKDLEHLELIADEILPQLASQSSRG